MNITLIGTGNIGSALGQLIANNTGHALTYGSREPNQTDLSAEVQNNAQIAAPADAVAGADIVILATPFPALSQIATEIGGADALAGVIVVDVSNPLTDDMMGLTVTGQDSAGETVARTFPGARVVKAFNTVFADVMEAHQPDKNLSATVFVAGDDASAKATVITLAAELGFDALDAGPLQNSRYLESMLEQMIQLAQGQNMGMNIRLRVLRA